MEATTYEHDCLYTCTSLYQGLFYKIDSADDKMFVLQRVLQDAREGSRTGGAKRVSSLCVLLLSLATDLFLWKVKELGQLIGRIKLMKSAYHQEVTKRKCETYVDKAKQQHVFLEIEQGRYDEELKTNNPGLLPPLLGLVASAERKLQKEVSERKKQEKEIADAKRQEMEAEEKAKKKEDLPAAAAGCCCCCCSERRSGESWRCRCCCC